MFQIDAIRTRSISDANLTSMPHIKGSSKNEARFPSTAAATALAYFLTLSLCYSETPSEEALPRPFPTPPLPTKILAVGVTNDPPFNIRNSDGSWTGISVELWQELARELGLKYEFRETGLIGRFRGLAEGWLDGAYCRGGENPGRP